MLMLYSLYEFLADRHLLPGTFVMEPNGRYPGAPRWFECWRGKPVGGFRAINVLVGDYRFTWFKRHKG